MVAMVANHLLQDQIVQLLQQEEVVQQQLVVILLQDQVVQELVVLVVQAVEYRMLLELQE